MISLRTAWPALVLALGALPAQEEPLVIGSKNFTESAVLAEIMAQLVEARTDIEVERRFDLSGTLTCFAALRNGEIDVYPDYTGTGWSIVLKEPGKITDPLRAYLHVARRYREEYGIRWLLPFGLNNTYALAMDAAKAAALDVNRISDLVPHTGQLKAGFSIEFLNREDGWPGLQQTYGLEFASVRGLEHGLAYAAIAAGELDVIDAYSTDAKLRRYPLRVLEDDRDLFPPYNAAPLVREDSLQRYPQLEATLDRLAFRLSDERMQGINYRVEEDGLSFAAAAREFLVAEGLIAGATPDAMPDAPGRRGFFGLMADRAGITLALTGQHLKLTVLAVLLAALVAIPLGIAITRRPKLRRVALGGAGVIQTIPSLALLAFMIPIPFLGLHVRAAIAALFLYSILPILRNTYTGIQGVDPDLIEAARGMGLRERQILLRVQLPLSLRTIMAGVRTAAVISIGVATLAAFIGAGGLGEPIVTGLYLNDTNLILSGAIPAALLALFADLVLGWLETVLAPRTRSTG